MSNKNKPRICKFIIIIIITTIVNLSKDLIHSLNIMSIFANDIQKPSGSHGSLIFKIIIFLIILIFLNNL